VPKRNQQQAHPGLVRLTVLYKGALEAGFALLPLTLVGYLDWFQRPPLVFHDHVFHVVAVGLAIALALFAAWVACRCYRASGEPSLRYLTLAFLGFALVYAPHGALTPLADRNPWLFLLFGPASRVVMAAFVLEALVNHGRAADAEGRRVQGWVVWMAAIALVDVAVAVLATLPVASDPQIRLSLETLAMMLSLAGLVLIRLRGLRSSVMTAYQLALVAFATASFAFLLTSPWTHLWWLAHAISAGGFFVLTHALVRAFLTTRSFDHVYSEEEMVAQIAKADAAMEMVRVQELAAQAAEMANRAKTEFLAAMSHELRTPLNAINGFAETMQAEILGPLGNERYKEYCGHIVDAGHHLAGLINDVLDVSRVESGRVSLSEEVVTLSELVESVAVMVGDRAREAHLTLATELSPDLPLLSVDPLRLKQILLNLLANAVKFTPKGGNVTVRAWVRGDGGVSAAIEDTGIGIDPVHREKVLRAFGQADSRLERRYEGMGLGLPLARSLMELHDGALELDSAPGQGTRVVLTFPAWRSLASIPQRERQRG
jgi:signal transduction histidine kinase